MSKPDGLVFNLDGVTGRDMQAFGAEVGGVAAQIRLFTRTVVTLPEGWGDPAQEETYRKLPFKRFVTVRKCFTEDINALKPATVDGLAFDVENVTTEEMETVGQNIPEMMAKYAKKTPKYWETPVTADTLLDLPYPVYLAVMERFKSAIEDLGKN